MLRILKFLSVLVFFVFIFTGCDTDVQKKPEPVVASEPKPAPAPQPTPQQDPQVASAPDAEPAKPPTVVRSADSAMPGAIVINSQPQKAEGHKVADVGDGRKGHYGRLGITNYAVTTYFRMQERISFDLIKHDLQIYEAMYGPIKTHEEFMEKIINANRSIKLPELKDGCRYEYNPETKELEVVYPIEN